MASVNSKNKSITINTQECKDFLSKHAKVFGASKTDTWSRVKKYSYNGLVLRDFKNQNGLNVTLAQSPAGLYVYTQEIDMAGVKNTSKKKSVKGEKRFVGNITKEDVISFMLECVEKDNDIISPDSFEGVLECALEYNSWTIWETIISEFEERGDIFALYYLDANNNRQEIDPEKIKKIHWLGMYNYDTAYRIYIFQTNDNRLVLGHNDSD